MASPFEDKWMASKTNGKSQGDEKKYFFGALTKKK